MRLFALVKGLNEFLHLLPGRALRARNYIRGDLIVILMDTTFATDSNPFPFAANLYHGGSQHFDN